MLKFFTKFFLETHGAFTPYRSKEWPAEAGDLRWHLVAAGILSKEIIKVYG